MIKRKRTLSVIFMLVIFSIRIFAVEFVKKNTKQELCPVPKMVTGTTDNMDKFNDVMSELQAKILKYNKHKRDANKIWEEYVLEDDNEVQHLKYYIYKGVDIKEDVGELELIIDNKTGKIMTVKYTDFTHKGEDDKPVTYVNEEIIDAVKTGLLIGVGAIFIVAIITLILVAIIATPTTTCCCTTGSALLDILLGL